MFWPGSEVEGKQPDYWFPYDGSVEYSSRVDQVLEWLALPTGERPSFVTLYLSAVDSAGHSEGPESQAVKDAILEVDVALAQLLDGIAELPDVQAGLNLLVVADHGMAQMDAATRVIFLDDYVDVDQLDILKMSPVTNIWPKEDSTLSPADVVAALAGVENLMGAYEREATPEAFQYTTSDRIPPVIVVAEVGYTITTRAQWDAADYGATGYLQGTHGFNNAAVEMAAIFVASGPAFVAGSGAQPTQEEAAAVVNLDLVELMAAVLDITPPANNGTLANVSQFLR